MDRIEKIPRSTPEEIDESFEYISNNLRLTKDDFAEGQSITDVGSGGNELAAGAKRKGYKAFVMGIEAHPRRSTPSDPTWGHATADNMGFPSEFSEQFDLVISHNAFPGYILRSMQDKMQYQKFMSTAPHDRYSYEGLTYEKPREEAKQEIRAGFLEMYRMTKPGGKIKIYPFGSTLSAAFPGARRGPEIEVLRELEKELGFKYDLFTPWPTHGYLDPEDRFVFSLEIRKPA